jgi:hypothetical protein
MTKDHLQTLKEDILRHSPEPKTLDELAWVVIETINRHRDVRGRKTSTVKVAGFAWEIYYGDVSNSHQRPIGGVDNWGRRKEGAPESYPGWNGRVWIRYESENGSFGSDPFRSTLTYPGTGGWGGYNGPWGNIADARHARYAFLKRVPRDSYPEPQIYSWDYKFFASDWPLLEDWVEKQLLVQMLTNRAWDKHHSFRWEDPVILAADKMFLEEAKTKQAISELDSQRTKYG